jgi:hypothetical protein
MEMEGLEQKCQRRRCKRLSRGRVGNDDEFADLLPFVYAIGVIAGIFIQPGWKHVL